MKIPKKIHAWQMVELDKPFQLIEKKIPELEPGEVLVEVAGCGVCHTDISFWHFGVKTRLAPPLTLGHEISGRVIAGDPSWLGRAVIVPAVLPCGECEFCRNGRSNVCRSQLMPGNDFDGGFASHVIVPGRFLCSVPEVVLSHFQLEQLAVIADAVSTPYQVVEKSELKEGDFVITIGAGGIGNYGAQLAKIKGGCVLALDIDQSKLDMVKKSGIDAVLNIDGLEMREVKEKVKTIANELGAPRFRWKIFEMSGTKAGQELAFNLLNFASTLSIVGFTMDKLEVRLSNLMAYDAKMIGTWGCRAELYPEIVDLVGEGKIKIKPYIETFPMAEINDIFQKTLQHKFKRRSILIADF